MASISEHAIIGDCRSAALIARSGEIAWLCWPRCDDASLFGSLLDPRGGRFFVGPVGRVETSRRYIPDTNVLETEHQTPRGRVRVTDLMPVSSEEDKARGLHPQNELLRVVDCLDGEVVVEIAYEPRPGYGASKAKLVKRGALGIFLDLGSRVVVLRSSTPLDLRDGGAYGRVTLSAGERLELCLVMADHGPAVLPPLGERTRALVSRSVAWWRGWSARLRYKGPYREAVMRSALTLKLLTYAPSGAIIASPTTSLPERAAGDLNWDYRYCWLRDASFTARVLIGCGYFAEAEEFVGFLLHLTRLTQPAVKILYDVYGNRPQAERELAGWEGYGGARPVRVGNAAEAQLQLDVYGEIIDATAQLVRAGKKLDRVTQKLLVGLGAHVCRYWHRPDEGLWEPRSGRRHHTHSRLMCWVALDRLLELHGRGQLAGANAHLFDRTRSWIRADIEGRAYDAKLGAYTSVLEGDDVDASALLLARYNFEDARSARMVGTHDLVGKRLRAGDDLLYRYRNGDSPGEGAFAICSFWEVDYLTRAGRLGEAARLFERLLAHANDVGLYAEEVDPRSGTALGNFPLGLTHVGLVNAALTLEKARADEAGRKARGDLARLTPAPRAPRSAPRMEGER